MGEQSTSWTVDSIWTDQAEHRMEVDTADMADINAQPGSTSDQPPFSPSDMPPNTRAQTARSSRAPTLDALPEEGVRDLDTEDDPGEDNPVPRTPPGNDSAEEQRTGTQGYTTPKCRQTTRSILPVQRDAAQRADPNHGLCLITNRPSVVELCHVIAVSTDHTTLSKLEYAWEMEYRTLNIDTRYNMMHLRVDWHRLFDKPEWVLIPEADVLRQLNKIYLEDECVTSDITKLFTKPTYNYYVLPTPALREPICRFLDADLQKHDTHLPPFVGLGPLQSHVLPHFVVFNTGEKLSRFAQSTVLLMIGFLARIITSADDALSMITTMIRLYEAWTNVKVPNHFRSSGSASNRSNPQSEAGKDDPSRGGPPRREGLRSGTRSQEHHSEALGGGDAEGQQRAIYPFPPSEDEESVTDDTVVDDSTDWIDYIHEWREKDGSATEKQEPNVLNDSGDEQLAAYIGEHARTPPSPAAWNSWKSEWNDSKSRYPTTSDRSRFSSNDWAVFKNDTYLTRLEYPRATV